VYRTQLVRSEELMFVAEDLFGREMSGSVHH
jgi:hypothetical protein